MKPKILPVLSLAVLTAIPFCASATELKTEKQKLSYIIGYQVGFNLKREGADVDPSLLAEAVQDALNGVEPKLTKEEMQATMKAVQEKKVKEQKALLEQNEKAGQEFLAANKKKEGVVELPSGLQYKILKAGSGDQPKADDTVTVNYKGTLINGKQFDSSYDRGQPATFPLSGVIQGWQEALQLMKEGANWEIYVPAKLAYGSRGAGGDIGPGETLVFNIELLEIQKKDEGQKKGQE